MLLGPNNNLILIFSRSRQHFHEQKNELSTKPHKSLHVEKLSI